MSHGLVFWLEKTSIQLNFLSLVLSLQQQTPREESASSRLSLEAEIDQFHLKEEREVQEKPVEISNFEGELNRAFAARPPKLIVTQVDPNSEEGEKMDLNPRRSLKDLTGRNKRSSSKEVSKS